MKITSILLILVFLTIQIKAQGKVAYAESTEKINSQPEFPGGSEGLAAYLSKNIKYPRNSRTASTRGKVLVSFEIEKDGKVSDVGTLSYNLCKLKITWVGIYLNSDPFFIND